ncbi:hypothetical protein AHAS_Ahas13G0415300 [Arachis hypogaea]
MSTPSVGDGSSSSGGTGPGAPLRDDGSEVVPMVNPDQYVIMEDLEQMLRRACDALKAEPPVFVPRDCVHVQGERYYEYMVHVEGPPDGVNFVVFGRFSADERMARQDAALSSLYAVVGESGKEILDFNYDVAQSCRERLMELQRVSSLSVDSRVAELETENARLRERLDAWETLHGRA